MAISQYERERRQRARERAKPVRMYPRDVPLGVTIVVRVYGGGTEEVELIGNEIVQGYRQIAVRNAKGEMSVWSQNPAAKLDVKKGTLPK